MLRRQVGLVFLGAAMALAVAAQTSPSAEPPQGVVAKGTVTLQGPRGAENGTITVSAWGENHCKIEIQLGPPVLRRDYTAVMDGNRVSVTGPAVLLASAPLPLSPQIGCAFLPEGLA